METVNIPYGNIIRALIKYGIPIGLFLYIIWFLFTYSFYTFSISGQDKKDNISIVSVQRDESSDISRLFNLYLIPRSADFLEVSSNNKKMRLGLVNKPIISVKHESINLVKQKKLTKIGINSLGCNGRSQLSYYSYECYSDSSSVMTYANRDNNELNNTLREDIFIDPQNSVMYQDGFLDVSNSDGTEPYVLSYTNISTNSITTKSVPVAENSDRVQIAVDSAGTEAFALIDSSKGVLNYYKNFTSKPVTLKKQATYTSDLDTTGCSLRAQTLACYYGVSSEEGTGHSTVEKHNGVKDKRGGSLGAIELYDFSNKTVHSYKSGDRPLQEICLLNNSTLYAASGNNLLVTKISETKKRSDFVSAARDVNELACGQEVLYSTEDSLYRLKETSSYLVFHERRMSVSTLQSYRDDVLFNIYLNEPDNDDIAHIYKVNFNADTKTPRPESILPYTTNTSDILEMDYTDTVMYIKPTVSGISDHQTGEFIIDQDELRLTKERIESSLKRDGLLGKYRIIYSQ